MSNETVTLRTALERIEANATAMADEPNESEASRRMWRICANDAKNALTAGVAIPASGWEVDKLPSSLAWPADISTHKAGDPGVLGTVKGGADGVSVPAHEVKDTTK